MKRILTTLVLFVLPFAVAIAADTPKPDPKQPVAKPATETKADTRKSIALTDKQNAEINELEKRIERLQAAMQNGQRQAQDLQRAMQEAQKQTEDLQKTLAARMSEITPKGYQLQEDQAGKLSFQPVPETPIPGTGITNPNPIPLEAPASLAAPAPAEKK